jgi:hypothetical protein
MALAPGSALAAIPPVRTAADDAPPVDRASGLPPLHRAIVVAGPALPENAGSPAPLLAERLRHRGLGVEVLAHPWDSARPTPRLLDLVVGVTGPDGEATAAAQLARRSGARLILVVTGLAHHLSDPVASGLRDANE